MVRTGVARRPLPDMVDTLIRAGEQNRMDLSASCRRPGRQVMWCCAVGEATPAIRDARGLRSVTEHVHPAGGLADIVCSHRSWFLWCPTMRLREWPRIASQRPCVLIASPPMVLTHGFDDAAFDPN